MYLPASSDVLHCTYKKWLSPLNLIIKGGLVGLQDLDINRLTWKGLSASINVFWLCESKGIVGEESFLPLILGIKCHRKITINAQAIVPVFIVIKYLY